MSITDLCRLPNEVSHRQSRKCQAPCLAPCRDVIARRTLEDDPSGSRVTNHLDTLNVQLVDKRSTSHVPCLQLLFTVWAGRVTINLLPDEVLLLVFHFDRSQDRPHPSWDSWKWNRLVHVCRKWRSVVFESPNFLELRLVCHPWIRVELTRNWLPLPIIITNSGYVSMPEDYEFDAAIVHPNRVCEINLSYLERSQLQRLASAMQVQFPSLTILTLGCRTPGRPGTGSGRLEPVETAPDLPDGFLGGSAPSLRTLNLNYIAFPALPKLLKSATHLSHLTLLDIPYSVYISPDTIVTCLALLANLVSLTIGFISPLSRHDLRRRRPPQLPTRTVLPTLTRFVYHGSSEYLEDLVARIDTPLLDSIEIAFLFQLIFDSPHLSQFMRRSTRVEAPHEAHVVFGDYNTTIKSHPPGRVAEEKCELKITCDGLDWQLSSAAQVCTAFFPSIHMVEHLYIHKYTSWKKDDVKNDIENEQWLELFHSFTAVKNLYVSEEYTQCIASALQESVGEGMTDALPALKMLFFEGLQLWGGVWEVVRSFAAARGEPLGRRITINPWKSPLKWRSERIRTAQACDKCRARKAKVSVFPFPPTSGKTSVLNFA